ncbi:MULTISPECIES: NADPH-dependent 2,4-dienoyl-CoA reductase [unclassified Bradyrhizobium]|uniref:NADPH-dependent 2,4-dienoyl-CoA reductase n=1 Tax=unclassified Bradyrhizobium TaxID=2631580 RepID=UPI00247A672D|nr:MULTISPECIES: NADPH-dependent 2,4-dienoyl-CoA reductase [unclassified Bradyrhizobium]WGS19667.1 NADPH-dependent 2,4-dienoyl-CoA reductase [Bradyrhizobium sp. ISRA463]WGS26509.1 NADPH-dependent 2,4-dienoyl-CoA reductase [Bradyrhizobium sp. ISRA464]
MADAQSVLLDPIRVGSATLKSRIVMGSMHTGLECHPERFDELGRFYAERAKGGAGLIVTGGFAPNFAGRMKNEPGTFERPDQVPDHRKIVEPVYAAGGRILLQILHAGRYGYHPAIVAPSPIKSPINRDVPAELSAEQIEETIRNYAATARLAIEAGYDGVEIMGSEGYLISEFLAPRTNHRTDAWGGALENRARFPLAVIRAVGAAIGDAIISYRISALELVEGGLTQDETIWLAREVEKSGADCLSTGIGWHEAAVPTIAGPVPHAAFIESTRRLKNVVKIPVTASNRINLPDDAARIIADGAADLVSMARPLLADAEFVNKVGRGRADLVNVCIACNQACLDHYFTDQVITCLVNPRAARETEFTDVPAAAVKRVAVVGAGVAGMAAALEAGRRGHHVTLFEAAPRIGGQFALAANIPGKEDYGLSLDSYEAQLSEAGVEIRTGTAVDPGALKRERFDEVIVSTGVSPRLIDIPGGDDPRVVGYTEVLDGTVKAGDRVVVIGGGGIGHDVALFLAMETNGRRPTRDEFFARWGINGAPTHHPARRQIIMVKRSPGAFGRTLGKSTGWILRQELKDLKVRQIAEARYLKIEGEGLHIALPDRVEVLPADTIVVCAGQESDRGIADEIAANGQTVHVIGGARLASELDAKRAIYEGAILGNRI